MVTILIMVTTLHMVALGDRCFFATGGRQKLYHKNHGGVIDFFYRGDSYLQSRFLALGQNRDIIIP